MVTRSQLLAFGLTSAAIEHRLAKGRLHQLYRGVYAVGRPELTRRGVWMAAVLSCGPGAVLSHASAAALWGIGREDGLQVQVSVPTDRRPRRREFVVHRRVALERTRRHGISVTTPACTLVDLAAIWPRRRLEAAVNEADKLDLIRVDGLRAALDCLGKRPGASALRRLLDPSTFVLTRSDLERFFLPIARAAGVPKPATRQIVNGFEVDFFWRELGLVIEMDGLRYHRTPLQQARDRIRDQAHTAAGLIPLRFTHFQIAFEPRHVEATLRAVGRRLQVS